MTPFLILHKVRGEPAFDIALRFDSIPDRYDDQGRVKPYMDLFDYIADDDPLPWWIIPTSGRRAYPYFSQRLNEIVQNDVTEITELPSDLPDHFPRPKETSSGLLNLLGLIPKTEPIQRRV